MVFHFTGIDVTQLDADTAARYMAMNDKAMIALKIMTESKD